MICPDAVPWLLAVPSDGDLPDAISAHLSGCAVCRALRTRLGLIDEGVRSACPPRPEVLARLEAMLDAVPRRRPAEIARPSLRRWAALATAALVVCTVGWFAGRSAPRRASPADEALRPGTPIPPARIEPLFVRIAGPGVKLVHLSDAAERIAALSAMADAIRAEVLRFAAVGPTEDIPRLARIHELLLRRGVVRRALALPIADRKAIAEPLVRSLRTDEEKLVESAARMPDAVAALVRPLADTLGAAVSDLETGRESPPATDDPSPTPLEAFVGLAVRLAETDGPLRRADLSLAMAHTLAAATVLVTVDADDDAIGKMGGYMDVVLDRGVDENLMRAEAEDPEGKLREPIAGIREKASQPVGILERNLAKIPPQAQKGLERAIEASKAGTDRAGKARKGNGPPWMRPDGAWVPPGLKKKP